MELQDLIQACEKGDTDGQKHLYQRYGGIVKAVCLRYIKGKEQALDVFHDCFVKLMFSLGKYNNQGSFEAWVRRVSVNYCLDILKKKNIVLFQEHYEDKITEEIEEIDTKDLMYQAIEMEISKEDWTLMIGKLPGHFAIVFQLFQIDNYSHTEIAQALGIEVKTSRTRLSRAKLGLRKIVEEFVQSKIEIEKKN